MATEITKVIPFGSKAFRKEDLMALDPVILGALLRERTHHNIEVPLYPTLLKWKGKPIPVFSGGVLLMAEKHDRSDVRSQVQ